MPEQAARNYRLLAVIQGITGGIVATVIFGLYGIAPQTLSGLGSVLPAAVLGVVGLIYFLTIHQLLSKSKLALSTMILTVITTVNVLLVIISTGGLDSPYYALWLLAIMGAGVFGRAESLGILGITLAYYLLALWAEGLSSPNLRDHLVQLVITIIAGGLAEWVHSRGRQAGAAATQLEQVAGQLSAEQIKADAIITSIGEGVMVIDANRRIQIFNKAAQQLSGWDESSAQNLDFNLVLQLKDSEDHPVDELNDPFSQAWKIHDTVVRQDLVMTTRSGRKVQLNISISPVFTAAGQASGAIALFRDISREKEVERQKDEFVSTASHEMRTPVAAIEGYISLAMNPNVASIDDRAKQYLDKAHQTISHLGELFRDLLSVTKAEEGQLNSKLEPVNLDKLVADAVADMQFAAGKKNLTLIYQIGGQTGKAISPLFYVAANPERLREVVMNLIENALKFTLEGGIKVGLEGNDKDVTVSVSDTGVGIATEDISHLFQKFYRIDNSATRTIGGTGLGLYLCRRVIEAFNGRIWVESKVNEGSTFHFTLPRLSQTEVTQMQAAMTSTQTRTTAPTESSTDISAPTQAPSPTPVPMPAPNPIPAAVPAPVLVKPTDSTDTLPDTSRPQTTVLPAPAKRSELDGVTRRVT
jgi:two-component system, OmpR family, sensor histidine kinase VicK